MSSPINRPSSETPGKFSIPRGSSDVATSMVSRVEYSLTTREKSIAELETSLIYVGTCERQLEKITTLLALTIYSKDSREDREKYFYTAVELAQRCIEDDTIGVPYWREIISTFLHYIRPGMSPEETCSPAFMHLIHDYIQLESNTWIQKRLQHTAHLKESLNNKSTSEKILDTFEAAFGLIRLLIISDDSGEIITQHRIDASEIDTLRDPSKTVLRYTIVRPFDRTRTYCVLIDLGSMESANQIAEHHWKNIIQKIIDIYIERKEIEFCMNQHKIIDAIKFIEEKVEKMKIITSGQNNYRGFIEIVMRVMDPNISHESIGDQEYIDNLLQAIDICRLVTLEYAGNTNIQTQDIPQQIDHILGGRINRRVLDIVKMILLSRDETMNGLGYPTGLSKRHIPIEGRVYAIIRLYETLYGSRQLMAIDQTMQYWTRGGSLDSIILGIFLQAMADGKIGKKQIHTDQDTQISPYRETLYAPYIQSWTTIMDDIDNIEKQYLQYRTSEDIGEQSRLALTIKDLQFHLIEVADLMKVVFVTLHGQTPSDLIPGQPGRPDEDLTEVGIEDSRKKGEKFRGLYMSILSSPLLRAVKTAEIISTEIYHHVDHSIPSANVIATKALQNPSKHTDLNRHDFLSKFLLDQPIELWELLWRVISSPEESMDILVTHGTVARYANLLLTNLGSEGSITGNAIPIKGDMGDIHLIRGGRRIDWNLFFPFIGWKDVIHEVHIITNDTFGDTFCPVDHGDIHLIHLHKKFLDYIDLKNETSPRKIGAFINRLNRNPRTKHFSAILRKEGKIQSRKRKKYMKIYS